MIQETMTDKDGSSQNPMDLTGKIIIITGAGRGIGRTIARHLVSQGAQVALCSRTESELSETVRLLPGNQKNQSAIVDIAAPEEVQAFIDSVYKSYGHIDGIVNNAAVSGPVGYLEDVDLGEYHKTMQINLFGMINTTRAALPYMKQLRAGSIINFCGAAVGWKKYSSHISAYRVSKYAVYGFTESLAQELLPFNIRMNALLPGSVDTRLRTDLCRQKTPPKAGSPMSAAKLTAYLLSDLSASVTGKLISSNWDDWKSLHLHEGASNDSCNLTLRRLDGTNYSF